MFVHFFFSPRKYDIAGLMEAKPEELGAQIEKIAILRSTILYSCKFSVGAIVKAL